MRRARRSGTPATGSTARSTRCCADGWTGAAARSYADGWADWRAASDTVLEGLLTMGRLLDAVHADLTERDLDADASLDPIAGRLVERLEP